MMGITVTLDNKPHKVLVDYKVNGRGVNGDTVKNEIMPKVLKHFNIEYESFTLYDFRYYLDQGIYKLTVNTPNGGVLEGHYISTMVMSNKVLTIGEEEGE